MDTIVETLRQVNNPLCRNLGLGLLSGAGAVKLFKQNLLVRGVVRMITQRLNIDRLHSLVSRTELVIALVLAILSLKKLYNAYRIAKEHKYFQ